MEVTFKFDGKDSVEMLNRLNGFIHHMSEKLQVNVEMTEAATFIKATSGTMMQHFNHEGEFMMQEFIPKDEVSYEYDGLPINVENMPMKGQENAPFNHEPTQIIAYRDRRTTVFEVREKHSQSKVIMSGPQFLDFQMWCEKFGIPVEVI